MYYGDTEENRLKRKHHIITLGLYLTICLVSYYILDESYFMVLYTFPIGLFLQFLIRCLIQRKTNVNHGYFYNKTRSIFKIFVLMVVSGGTFYGNEYLIIWKTAGLYFEPSVVSFTNLIEYNTSISGLDDTYWSLEFQLNTSILINITHNKSETYPQKFVGCGCGIEYGFWAGDSLFNPAKPFKYYEKEFGIDGVRLPTFLCLCFSRERCINRFINITDNEFYYYYRVIGNPELALQNQKCPPDDLNFIQIYRSSKGVSGYHVEMFNFLLAFSTFSASAANFVSIIYIYFTANYGKRISFVVLNSMLSVGVTLYILSTEKFQEQIKFYAFAGAFVLSGYIYIIYFYHELSFVGDEIRTGFWKTFKRYKPNHPIAKQFWKRFKNGIKFALGMIYLAFNLIVIQWLKGRLKIFILPHFKLNENRYSSLYNKRSTMELNRTLNIITIIDALVLNTLQGAILANIIFEKFPNSVIHLEIAGGFIIYESLSNIYPLIRQIFMMKSFNLMLISLNPRYYNVEVIRKERELRNLALDDCPIEVTPKKLEKVEKIKEEIKEDS